MTQIGATANKVTVTNWFSATGNRIDFVNFTNVEKTSAEIDALFANGGLGGTFASSVPMSSISTSTADLDGPTSVPGPKGTPVQWQPIKDFDGYTLVDARPSGTKDAAVHALVQPIKTFELVEGDSPRVAAEFSGFDRR